MAEPLHHSKRVREVPKDSFDVLVMQKVATITSDSHSGLTAVEAAMLAIANYVEKGSDSGVFTFTLPGSDVRTNVTIGFEEVGERDPKA